MLGEGAGTRAAAAAVPKQRALDEWRYRSNLIEEETQEPITNGTIKIEVVGGNVGTADGAKALHHPERAA